MEGNRVIFSASEVLPLARLTGYKADMIEKVLHLLLLLNALNTHPYAKGKWVLKGGTALNLFNQYLPRLSVDIDLNYIGALDRENMLTEKPKFEAAIQAVCAREGFNVRRVPDEHAGGKWRLSYQSYTGQSGNLEIDLNYMFRQPLWKIKPSDSYMLGSFKAINIPVLDIHEIAAGKLAALLSRGQARDLFDSHWLLKSEALISEKLRLAFVVYGAMNRLDWRDVTVENINFKPDELARQLLPTLKANTAENYESPTDYGLSLIRECRERISSVLPFTISEKTFLDLLLDQGVINATLLTANPGLQQRIQDQPLLQWKAHNVRKYKGLSE
jgi:predicted nucleotidyltransferase component of viral defense system